MAPYELGTLFNFFFWGGGGGEGEKMCMLADGRSNVVCVHMASVVCHHIHYHSQLV